jgi:hypothetical protein
MTELVPWAYGPFELLLHAEQHRRSGNGLERSYQASRPGTFPPPSPVAGLVRAVGAVRERPLHPSAAIGHPHRRNRAVRERPLQSRQGTPIRRGRSRTAHTLVSTGPCTRSHRTGYG